MTALGDIELDSTALLLIDLQNDFIHPQGAYARGGALSPQVAALPASLAPLTQAARQASVPVISTQFTLVPGPDGPLLSPHLARLRPFLGAGDFAPGSWGQQMVDELGSADVVIEKVAYSAFYATRMDFVLRRLGIETVLIAGIVTNGGVASTARDAHVRDLSTVVLADGCAAFTSEAHDSAIASLATVCSVSTIADALGSLAEAGS